MKKDTTEGGYGFKSFNEFMTTLMDSKDQQLSASMSRFSNQPDQDQKRARLRSFSVFGPVLVQTGYNQFKTGFSAKYAINFAILLNEYKNVRFEGFLFLGLDFEALTETLQKEGKAVKEIFSRGFYTSVSELLKTFSMEALSQQLQEAAPTIWKLLTEMSLPLYKWQKENQRDENLIFTTMCAMMGILQSTRATDFHITLRLFLLGSGASKREIEVLAHAGICISYSAILKHVRRLSEEGTQKFREAIGESACMIVWDNLNIAFHVGPLRQWYNIDSYPSL
ncbi:uncharacterized protein LACBIDRAFT_330279 [Laccaria bicolor S238N-H82]|uniref:Predicted protein n=1 Tax=Laccaria bicolor (strain S238N-H82 / ATCC MYA-4686) TaxID=486041 RepID=B0DKS5_LACBS|nr:uncharacterized protein LACBIDRAFT_330279 [Laccaria bicolor S238N-H82]EDR04697.1 predicted protein [Laccaria bicolor S238N-H82]|eukprot:XP_001884521.1 predicted protein [Laccaria bicolor S238N-H82]